MSKLNKVRVQLLDEETGSVLEEVDVMTSADAVSFADGQTFQQKLDAGLLKGQKGDTGATGPKGDTGEGFSIFKTYASVAAMNADKANVQQGKFVLIASNTDDVDNAKLYVKGATDFTFLTDLSGAQGIKGEKGNTGATGPQGSQGPKGDKGDTGETVRVGTDYSTATQAKLFFKLIN